jgi:hypothetical protein
MYSEMYSSNEKAIENTVERIEQKKKLNKINEEILNVM